MNTEPLVVSLSDQTPRRRKPGGPPRFPACIPISPDHGQRIATAASTLSFRSPMLTGIQTRNFLPLILAIIGFPCIAMSAPPATQPAMPPGQPTWIPLGDWVYQEKTVDEVEKQLLAFSRWGTWFVPYAHEVSKTQFEAYIRARLKEPTYAVEADDHGPFSLCDAFPLPTRINEVKTNDRGVTLALDIKPVSQTVLRFKMTLKSDQRTVWREIEHRHTDVVPLLFAIYIDGKPFNADKEQNGGRFGGLPQSIQLIPAGGGKHDWSLQVDAASINKLLPDQSKHTVMFFAAFSEVHWMDFFNNPYEFSIESTQRLESRISPPEGHDGPQILVRSNAAEIQWNGKKWTSSQSRIDH